MEIYNYISGQKNVIRDVIVDDNSYLYTEIMGDNNVVLSFSLPEYVDFPVGCRINFEYREFTMLEIAHFKKENERSYSYTLTFESDGKRLQNYKFRNVVDGRLNFTLTAQPFEFIQHVCDNMNMRDGGTAWQVGDCVESSEKTLSFSQTSCLDALSQIAQLFETEYEIDNKIIHLRKVEYNKHDAPTLSYGKGNGFLSGITRQNSSQKAVDVVWAECGDRNINSQTYTYEKVIEGQTQTLHANKLRLPKNEIFYYQPSADATAKGSVFSNEEIQAMFPSPEEATAFKNKCIAVKTDEDGFGVSRYPASSYINNGYEDCVDLTHIYPHKNLTITDAYCEGLAEKNVEKYSNRFWNIQCRNCEIDYNDSIIAGEEATIIFDSGMLSGKEFNIANQGTDKKPIIWNPVTQEFHIQPAAIDGITMPDLPSKDERGNYIKDIDGNIGTDFIPRVGDVIGVFHVNMPQKYIEEAEKEALLEACEYLHKHSDVEVEFNGTLDGIWAKARWDKLRTYLVCGGYINFYDSHFCASGKLMRIMNIKRYINNPHSPEITLSNSSVSQSISSEIKKIPANQVYTEQLIQDAARLAQRRSFKDSEETAAALQLWSQTLNDYYNQTQEEFNNVNEQIEQSVQDARTMFTTEISPITVQTMQLLVGDKSLQYDFGYTSSPYGSAVTSYTMQTYMPYMSSDGHIICPEAFSNGKGVVMRHRYYTSKQGSTDLTPLKTSNYPYWKVRYAKLKPTNPDAPYYLYLVCPRSATTTANIGKLNTEADWLLVEISKNVALPVNNSTYYYFLCGILNSEIDGTRSYSNMYGSVEIQGSQINLSRIVSQNGSTYFDLINNVIKGNIQFTDGLLTGDFLLGASRNSPVAGIHTMGTVYLPLMWIGGSREKPEFGLYPNGDAKFGDLYIKSIDRGYAVKETRMGTANWSINYDGTFHNSTDGGNPESTLKPGYLEINGKNGYYTLIKDGYVQANRGVNTPFLSIRRNSSISHTVPAIVWSGYVFYQNGYYAQTKFKGDIAVNVNVSRMGTGKVKCSFEPAFSSTTEYFVTCLGDTGGGSNKLAYVTIAEKAATHIVLMISDDASTNDHNFQMQVWFIPS